MIHVLFSSSVHKIPHTSLPCLMIAWNILDMFIYPSKCISQRNLLLTHLSIKLYLMSLSRDVSQQSLQLLITMQKFTALKYAEDVYLIYLKEILIYLVFRRYRMITHFSSFELKAKPTKKFLPHAIVYAYVYTCIFCRSLQKSTVQIISLFTGLHCGNV